MPLIKGTNSYVDVSEADAYFSTRLGSSAWVEALEPTKESALVTATQVLNQMEWAGLPVSSDQPLAFPRSIADVYETTPVRILQATYEMALHLLNNPDLLDDTGGVESLSVGPISLYEIRSPKLIPQVVQRLIAPYSLSSGAIKGSRAWWRAN